MKIALIVKIRNGALYEVLQEKGWTQADLARAVDTTDPTVSAWMQMRSIPKSPGLIRRVEVATGRLFEDLFPAELAEMPAGPRTIATIRDMPVSQLAHRAIPSLPSPEAALLDHEHATIAQRLLDTLSPQEAMVIQKRFGLDGDEQSLKMLSATWKVSPERIRQIEAHALRKLRDPSRANALRRYRDGDGKWGYG